MTTNDNWQRYCDYYRSYPDVGISLDISKISFPADYFSKMTSPSQEALAAMGELEGGAISNPDEKRMVGHYWLRNAKKSPTEEISKEIENSISKIKLFVADVHAAKCCASPDKPFSDVLLIGIGGSALGPQLLQNVFSYLPPKMQLHFFDNTDPDGMERTLVEIGEQLKTTLVLVVSKSGGTTETKNGQKVAAEIFTSKGLQFSKHAIAITVENSALDLKAKEEGWLDSFYLWDWVGGRTSIFSAVGLLPAALIGADIEKFLDGAAKMDEITRDKDLDQNPAMLLALMWYWAGDGVGNKSMVVLPYKDSLALFSKYLQQLVMESLGKEKDLDGNTVHQGLTVFGNKGSTDQHAYVQQLRDGLANFFVTFIEVYTRTHSKTLPIDEVLVDKEQSSGDYLHGFYQGTRQALAESGRGSISVSIDELCETRVGALIALYERAVGLYAYLINVNAYHQPGVEAGKKAASEVIALQRKIESAMQNTTEAYSIEKIAELISEPNRKESIFKILCSLHYKPSSSIKCVNDLNPLSAKFEA
ncbi:UNVERIFIED_CONTAM: hypothetical protein GTU68_054454 [Idotea baltica]|nr:hypothetical protein [Idotea baltica]